MDYVRVDDRAGDKGLYLINAIDEVTQFEFIGAVEHLSEAFLIPVLTALIKGFPFVVNGFHADNGSEYVNHQVARLLRKLHVGQFTKSRPWRSNDNAPSRARTAPWCAATSATATFRGSSRAPSTPSPRTCCRRSSTTVVPATSRSRRRRRRPRNQAAIRTRTATPHEKFKPLDDAAQYLRPGVTIEQLDAFARAVADLDAARNELFCAIGAEAAA